MSRTLTFTAAFLSALLLGSGAAVADDTPPEATADPAVPRVLLTGDSITQGYHGDYTWRYRLAKEFLRQGAPVDFVGSKNQPYIAAGYTTTRYYDPNFDSDHFARVGAQLKDLRTTIGAEVTAQQPDVIVLGAGLNDLLNAATPVETNLRLTEWVANARAAKPDVRIVLSPVLTIDRANRPEANSNIAAYNRLLRVSALTLNTPQSPITMADTDRDWKPKDPTYSIDGIHAAPTGETIIAQRIGETLQGLGLLPATPKIQRVVRWTRTLKPRVAFAGKRATITWFGQKLSGATLYSHRTRSSLYRWHYGGKAVVSVSPGVRYTFRLRLRRDRVTGPWGPILTVTAPRT